MKSSTSPPGWGIISLMLICALCALGGVSLTACAASYDAQSEAHAGQAARNYEQDVNGGMTPEQAVSRCADITHEYAKAIGVDFAADLSAPYGDWTKALDPRVKKVWEWCLSFVIDDVTYKKAKEQAAGWGDYERSKR